jgi:hypothetical protein
VRHDTIHFDQFETEDELVTRTDLDRLRERGRSKEGAAMLEWISQNKAWLFSGALVAAPIAIVGWIIAKRAHRGDDGRQIQKSGANSVNVQGGRDVKVGETKIGGR